MLMVSTHLTEKNEPKMSSVAQMEAEIPYWAIRGLPRVTRWVWKGPFLGLPNPAVCLIVLSMSYTYLTEKNKLKMSSVAQIEAEIPFWALRSSPEGDHLGLKGPFLGPVPVLNVQMYF